MNSKKIRIVQIQFIALSVFSLIQFAEIFLHPEVLFYHELWSTLSLMSILFFGFFGFLPVLILQALGEFFLGKLSWYQRKPYLVPLFLSFCYLLMLQVFLFEKVYYEVSHYYWMVLTCVLLVLTVILSQSFVFRLAFSFLFMIMFSGLSLLEWYSFGVERLETSNKKSPNILVLFSDTTRADHVSFLGYNKSTTPHIDEMAKKAAVFENVLSTSSWTKPAMASFFTSKYLLTNEIHRQEFPLITDQTGLAEFFSSVGYDTAFFSANPNASSYYRASSGFRYMLQPDPASHFPLYDFVLPRFLKYFANLPKAVQFENVRSRLVNFQEALGFSSIDELDQFQKNQIKSKVIAENESDLYRKQIATLLPQYEDLYKSIHLSDDKWRNRMTPLFFWIYQKSLEFVFVSLKGARGKVIVDHWLADYELVDDFKSWFKTVRDPNKPFLLHFQFMSPHTPYHEKPPILIPSFGAERKEDIEVAPAKHVLPSQGAPELPADELASLVDNYDSSIRVTDANIRDIISYLEEAGMMNDTIVVYVSDHGEAFYEHGIYDHMYSLYSELVHVPLMIFWKDKIHPLKSNYPASLVDLYPTLVTLAGYSNEQLAFDGQSLFDRHHNPVDVDADERERYGAVVLGVKPKPMLGVNNLYDPWNKSGHQQMQGYHRFIAVGGTKWVHEIEASDLNPASSDFTERFFEFKLDVPNESLVDSARSVDAAKPFLSKLPMFPKNLF